MVEVLPVVLAILLMQITPGPNMVAVTSIALGSGRRAGLLAAAGVASGVFVWAVLFSFGVDALLRAFPQIVIVMKLVGGGYLLYLAARAIRSSWRGPAAGGQAAGVTMTARTAWATGVFVVLTNPKAALMWVAVSLLLASARLSSIEFLAVGACCSLSAMAVYGTYAMLFSTGVAKRAYGRVWRVVDAAFGSLFGLFGAKLLADGIRELRA